VYSGSGSGSWPCRRSFSTTVCVCVGNEQRRSESTLVLSYARWFGAVSFALTSTALVPLRLPSHVLAFSRVSPEHPVVSTNVKLINILADNLSIHPTQHPTRYTIHSNATTHPQQPAQAMRLPSRHPTPHFSWPPTNTSSKPPNDGLSSHAGARGGSLGRLRFCEAAESSSRHGQNRTKRRHLE
jgi:hypothetical protein